MYDFKINKLKINQIIDSYLTNRLKINILREYRIYQMGILEYWSYPSSALAMEVKLTVGN